MACLVDLFYLGFLMDFIGFSGAIGLADEGSVWFFPFRVFSWPFFYSWGATLDV